MDPRGRLFSIARYAAPLALLATTASAHLMPAKRGTLTVEGANAFAALSLPVSALTDVDDDGDGQASIVELARHKGALEALVDRRLEIRDENGRGTTVLVNLILSPRDDGPADMGDRIVALKHVTFAAAPLALTVRCDLFGTSPEDRELTFTATRAARQRGDGKETEASTLTPGHTEHTFFRPIGLALLDYVRMGASHVLSGTDHLLFLLTILVTGLAWRRWLAVITAFTVAHSITLAAALLGYVHLSPRIVEPLIALSIVVMAVDNLVRGGGPPRQRAALVGGFGLLHGLGFAASMDAMGLDSAHRVASLIGFNLGVEVGQIAFVAAALVVIAAITRPLSGTRVSTSRVMRGASACALVTGMFWFVERVMG